MRIDRNLNLVFPVDTAGGEIHVHSMPISREVFERHHEVLGKTYAYLISEGLIFNAPKHAALLLRDIAKDTFPPGRRDDQRRPMSAWEGPDGVQNGLFPEIRRLTNIIVPGADGYETLPYDVALRMKRISEDDAAQIDGLIAFFTVASAEIGDQPEEMARHLDFMKARWSAEATSLNSTAFCDFLMTSTEDKPSTTPPASVLSLTTSPAPGSGNSSVVPI
jgi:hypothetical protein